MCAASHFFAMRTRHAVYGGRTPPGQFYMRARNRFPKMGTGADSWFPMLRPAFGPSEDRNLVCY